MNVLHPIIYFAHLGPRPRNGIPFVADQELTSPLLTNLGMLPKTVEQYALGYRYYYERMSRLIIDGYRIFFVYDDSLDSIMKFKNYPDGKECIILRLICTSNESSLKLMHDKLSNMHTDSTAYVFRKEEIYKSFNMPNSFVVGNELFQFLYEKCTRILGFDGNLFSVPIESRNIDRGYSFIPTRPNTFMLQSIVGNWNFPFNDPTEEQLSNDRTQAVKHYKEFSRQNILLGQLENFDKIDAKVFQLKGIGQKIEDEIHAPLILEVPFISHDIKDLYLTWNKTEEGKALMKGIWRLLKIGQTHNYTTEAVSHCENPYKDDFFLSQLATMQFILEPLSLHTNMVSFLHASYRNSPCLRLPVIGSNINRDLSFVSPKMSERLLQSKKRGSVTNVMTKIGNIISKHCLSKEAVSLLKNERRQIVSISDLPVEWMTLDGVPLSFTHDVCRMPYMHINSPMMHFALNSVDVARFSIPRDIMSHTLVVYGTDDSSFKASQDYCEELKSELVFQSVRCLSIKDFVSAVKEVHPQLLIIDTHGNIDLKLHQTYLLFGQERLYPTDITKYGISARLVFLSACNTAPTYNVANTLANGFFYTGAQSVVSSYLPIECSEASILYIRLLIQLKIAAQRPMFVNWLAFMADLLRTSYVNQAYHDYILNSHDDLKEITKEPLEIYKHLRSFEERRKIFFSLRNGKTINGIKINTKNIVPHYLMYSILGRADLIQFDSFIDNL